jgi:predicted type IV restriction endonuclease
LDQLVPRFQTEEATKNALIMPMLNALGYNVFDPTEVVPEFVADVGTKKGKKVDYAIFLDGKIMLLVECKPVGGQRTLNHASQLYRYFSVTDARFAVLTDGLLYKFFSDLESPNRMDEKPFFEFNLRDFDERSVAELKKFSKSLFNLENILSTASELKYAQQIQKLIGQEFDNPTDDFVRMFTAQVYSGRITAAVQDQFRVLVKSELHEFLRDRLNSRLRSAIDGTIPAALPVESPATSVDSDEAESDGLETTVEEIEGFQIVRAILSKTTDPARVVMRDTKSYCGVLLDDNNRKPVCRLRFNFSQKYIGLFSADKAETRHPIEKLTDIFRFADQIVATVQGYDSSSGKNDDDTSENLAI